VAISSLDCILEGSEKFHSSTSTSCHLKAEESALVDILLSRDDPVDQQPNPYDPQLVDAWACLTATVDGGSGPIGAPERQHSCCHDSDSTTSGTAYTSTAAPSVAGSTRSLSEIDAQLSDLALDHDWDESCSLVDLSSLSTSRTGSLWQSIAAAKCILAPTAASVVSSYALISEPSLASVNGAFGPMGGKRGSLPAIPEQGGGVSSQKCENSKDGSEGSPRRAKKASKHEQTDYLRPMREARELEALCAPPPLLFILGGSMSKHEDLHVLSFLCPLFLQQHQPTFMVQTGVSVHIARP
jgi:hypothetical protein